jgi:hypothetical protein
MPCASSFPYALYASADDPLNRTLGGSNPDAFSEYLIEHVSVCIVTRSGRRELTCPKSVSVHPPKTALPGCQFDAHLQKQSGSGWSDSPVLLARRGDLLHLAHALVIRDHVVVVTALDLVLA